MTKNPRDLLQRREVIKVLNEYRDSLLKDLETTPADLAIHHQLTAVKNIEHRIQIMALGGLRVIQGGKE